MTAADRVTHSVCPFPHTCSQTPMIGQWLIGRAEHAPPTFAVISALMAMALFGFKRSCIFPILNKIRKKKKDKFPAFQCSLRLLDAALIRISTCCLTLKIDMICLRKSSSELKNLCFKSSKGMPFHSAVTQCTNEHGKLMYCWYSRTGFFSTECYCSIPGVSWRYMLSSSAYWQCIKWLKVMGCCLGELQNEALWERGEMRTMRVIPQSSVYIHATPASSTELGISHTYGHTHTHAQWLSCCPYEDLPLTHRFFLF